MGLHVLKEALNCAWSTQRDVMPIYRTIALDMKFFTKNVQRIQCRQVVSIVENMSCNVILGNNFITPYHVTVWMWDPENVVVFDENYHVPITFAWKQQTSSSCQSIIGHIAKATEKV